MQHASELSPFLRCSMPRNQALTALTRACNARHVAGTTTLTKPVEDGRKRSVFEQSTTSWAVATSLLLHVSICC
ncbi:hypothetical protein V6N13_124304 [Hibiscus sabdariffa]|uniref:Secreted protein n=1 Tax=Hibiscus sabdariffa TaxID=183260 RepID=A0ABR2S188_9ROSI